MKLEAGAMPDIGGESRTCHIFQAVAACDLYTLLVVLQQVPGAILNEERSFATRRLTRD